jgi:hypothetical protein
MLSVESWNFTGFKRHRKALVRKDVHNEKDGVGHSMGKTRDSRRWRPTEMYS